MGAEAPHGGHAAPARRDEEARAADALPQPGAARVLQGLRGRASLRVRPRFYLGGRAQLRALLVGAGSAGPACVRRAWVYVGGCEGGCMLGVRGGGGGVSWDSRIGACPLLMVDPQDDSAGGISDYVQIDSCKLRPEYVGIRGTCVHQCWVVIGNLLGYWQ